MGILWYFIVVLSTFSTQLLQYHSVANTASPDDRFCEQLCGISTNLMDMADPDPVATSALPDDRLQRQHNERPHPTVMAV